MKREYTAKSLKAAYVWARQNPDGQIRIDRLETLTGAEWLHWFCQCLHKKASRGLVQVGRKWSNDWYWQAWRTSREVNMPRLVVRWVPFEFRKRLADRITTDND